MYHYCLCLTWFCSVFVEAGLTENRNGNEGNNDKFKAYLTDAYAIKKVPLIMLFTLHASFHKQKS